MVDFQRPNRVWRKRSNDAPPPPWRIDLIKELLRYEDHERISFSNRLKSSRQMSKWAKLSPWDKCEGDICPEDSRDHPYEELVRYLQSRNEEPELALKLWNLVVSGRSPGALRALQGIANENIRLQVRNAVAGGLVEGGCRLQLDGDFIYSKLPKLEDILQREKFVYREVSPYVPLVFLGTANPNETDLLSKAIQFQSSKLTEDKSVYVFCRSAAIVLLGDAGQAEPIALKMLETRDPIQRDALADAFRRRKPRFLHKRLEEFRKLPLSRAVYEICRVHQKRRTFDAKRESTNNCDAYSKLLEPVENEGL